MRGRPRLRLTCVSLLVPTGSVTSGRGAGNELRVGGGECECTARRPALVWSAGILPGGSDGACQWLGTGRGPRGRCPALLFRRGTFPASPHRLACDQPSTCLLALVAATVAVIRSGVCRPFGLSRACGAVPASAGAPRGPQGGSRGACRPAKRPLLTEAIIEPRPAARRPGSSSEASNRRRRQRRCRRSPSTRPRRIAFTPRRSSEKARLTVAPLRLKAAGTSGCRSVRDSVKRSAKARGKGLRPLHLRGGPGGPHAFGDEYPALARDSLPTLPGGFLQQLWCGPGSTSALERLLARGRAGVTACEPLVSVGRGACRPGR